MMKLFNSGCESINAISVYIDDVLTNPGNYDKIEIKAKANCCDTEYTDTIDVSVAQDQIVWSTKLPINSTLTVSKVVFRNTVTGQLVEIKIADLLDPTSPLEITDESDLSIITTEVNNFLADQYGGSMQLDDETLSIADLYTYGISGFEGSFVPVSITYNVDSIEATTSFLTTASEKNSYLTGLGLSITPLLFGLDSFIDGVYSIELSIFKNTGSRVISSNCIFLDCKTNCDLAAKLSSLTDTEKIEALMMHYGLTVGTNCACECNMLCDLFKQLYKIIYNTEINNTCGCN